MNLYAPAFSGFSSFATGLGLSFGLIVAIGAQNAFVLRQGIRREHIGPVVLFCLLSDALLITAGVAGMAEALGQRVWLARLLALAGGGFLAVYGARALLRALRPQALSAAAGGPRQALRAVLAQTAAFTFLNPHVYLDTVLLMGNLGARQPAALRSLFVGGAVTGSAIWFVLLGFGSRWLAPWFASTRAWQWLDLLTGATMWVIAWRLLPQIVG